MTEPVNLKVLRTIADKYREAERPYKEAGDWRGLGIGASALVIENAATEIERLREALERIVTLDRWQHFEGDGKWRYGECAEVAKAALSNGQ